MQRFSSSPLKIISSFWCNRNLIKTLLKREVVGRYRGSVMGILWSFFNPLFMLAVYTFVFGFIFKSRWNIENTSQTEFALILFSGLIVFNLFAECVNKSPTLILTNINYVKKVVFPLEILPWISLGSATFHALVSLLVWLVAYFILFGFPPLTSLLLPIVILPLIFFIMGLTWGLASLGVYLRDASQVVGIFTSIMMFLSPIFYPTSAIPEESRWMFNLNPLAVIIEQVRNVLLWGKIPNWSILGFTTFIGVITAWIGFVCFQRTRKGFADVI